MPDISLTGLHLGSAPQASPLNNNFLPRAFHPCNWPVNAHLGHPNTSITSLKISDIWLQCQSLHNIFKFHWNTPSSWDTSRAPIMLIFVGHTWAPFEAQSQIFSPFCAHLTFVTWPRSSPPPASLSHPTCVDFASICSSSMWQYMIQISGDSMQYSLSYSRNILDQFNLGVRTRMYNYQFRCDQINTIGKMYWYGVKPTSCPTTYSGCTNQYSNWLIEPMTNWASDQLRVWLTTHATEMHKTKGVVCDLVWVREVSASGSKEDFQVCYSPEHGPITCWMENSGRWWAEARTWTLFSGRVQYILGCANLGFTWWGVGLNPYLGTF
jgi:hypothetical protein